jgi:hypothetical protein
MGAFFVFLGTWLLSEFVALLAALQLADHFGATDEFVAVMLAIMAFAVIAIVAFAVAYRFAKRAGVFAWIAIALGAVVAALVLTPTALDMFPARASNPYTIAIENVAVSIELLVPAFIVLLAQWGLVRRRFLRVRGEDDLTLWPWITIVVAGLAVLNPFGLRVVGAALAQSPTDWLRGVWLVVALSGAGVLVVMSAVECYIRARMLRRRALGPAARA